MLTKIAYIGLACALFFSLMPQPTFSIGPADTLRNELGEIINVPPPGEPGKDYAKDQFVASLKPNFLWLPTGLSEARLDECDIEANLRNLLLDEHVHYVMQVFAGATPDDTIRVVDGETIVVPDLSQYYLFLQKEGSDVLHAVESMYSIEATLFSEPNYINFFDTSPSDQYWQEQWNLHDNANGIGCQFAWYASTGSRSVKIGIIDTGIAYDHADLGCRPERPNLKVVDGYDYADLDDAPYDYSGHGTGCAGIAGALTNNIYGVAGIAGGWARFEEDVGAELYAIKIWTDAGYTSSFVIARAIREAVDPNRSPYPFGCQILSNSYGTYNYLEIVRAAVNFAYRLGVSFVAAKGNDARDDPAYPADFDYGWVTAVASYGRNGHYCVDDVNCDHSSNYGRGIDITAPGTQIYTTAPPAQGYYYSDFGGTSAACPHVAGAIALIKSVKTGLQPEDAEWMVKFSANDDDEHGGGADNNVWTWNERYGHGDLRISTAMLRLGHPLVQSGYKLFEHTETGGYHVAIVRLPYEFIGAPLNGQYSVYRYTVRVPVHYPEEFQGIPFVWGVGNGSMGWSAANPNYQEGYCRVVPGSQTQTGCVLETYVYEVPDHSGHFYPCDENHVSLRYKVWGIAKGEPERPGGPKVDSGILAEKVALKSAYPNPFNSSILIEFSLPSLEKAQVVILDLLGRRVATLFDGKVSGGDYSVVWAGKNQSNEDVPSSVYFCKLTAGNKTITRKVTLLR